MNTRSAVVAVFASVLLAPALTPAADWPNWRGPYRTGVSDDKGLVSRWSRAGENLLWKKGPHRARHAGRVRRPRLHQRPRRHRGPRVMSWWPASTRTRDASCGRAASPSTTPPCPSRAWAGAALGADPETGCVFAQNVDGQLTALDREGKTVWQHRLGEEYGRGSGYGGRTLIPLVDEDRVVVGVVGRGLGRHRAPAPALHGVRQAHRRRAMDLHACTRGPSTTPTTRPARRWPRSAGAGS